MALFPFHKHQRVFFYHGVGMDVSEDELAFVWEPFGLV